ncbi:MAG: HNH endonuclease [Candidatus Acidiferrum sp.]
MEEELTHLVWERAKHCCEYCQLHQDYSRLTFEIDHVISKKHGGATVAGNLAVSCFYCNSFKGANIAGRDPHTKKLTPLFNPRRHKWSRHFHWHGPVLAGRTAIGRTTIAVLDVNEPDAVAIRAALIEADLFPPGRAGITCMAVRNYSYAIASGIRKRVA